MNQNPKPTVLVGVTDHLDPELQAMLLANYSRSYGSIVERIPLTQEESEKIKTRLRQTYVSYGHKSVGQLGHTTIFFEGVSMLAANAIEVSELFNGQASSTRFIPYDSQPAINFGHDRIAYWQEQWRKLYKHALVATIEMLKKQYARPSDVAEGDYERTIKARTFDICGGLLPAGFTTCVGFTGSFDVLNDHITWMAFHPLEEVRDLARLAADALMKKYPDAAYSWDKITERGQYQYYNGKFSDEHMQAYYYAAGSHEHDRVYGLKSAITQSNLRRNAFRIQPPEAVSYPIVDDITHSGYISRLTLSAVFIKNLDSIAPIDENSLQVYEDRLMDFGGAERKKYQSFPRFISNAVRFRLSSMMDFRSYRDMHRHRNGFRPLPLLTLNSGLHPYYVDNLPSEVSLLVGELEMLQWKEFDQSCSESATDISYNAKRAAQQYAIPMAAMVPYYYECDLNQLLYMLELRTDKTVHQTVRVEMMAAHATFAQLLPKVKVHVNLSANNLTFKRGQQTFSHLKEENKKE